jgi:hypothetical protein
MELEYYEALPGKEKKQMTTTVDWDRKVSLKKLAELASRLKSEDGENPEYDRALVELVTDAAGLPMTERRIVIERIGVKSEKTQT